MARALSLHHSNPERVTRTQPLLQLTAMFVKAHSRLLSSPRGRGIPTPIGRFSTDERRSRTWKPHSGPATCAHSNNHIDLQHNDLDLSGKRMYFTNQLVSN